MVCTVVMGFSKNIENRPREDKGLKGDREGIPHTHAIP